MHDVFRVQTGRRFVQNEELRFRQEGAGKTQLLAHTAAEARDVVSPPLPKPDPLEEAVNAALCLGPRESVDAGMKLEILIGGEPVVQTDLVQHDADPGPDLLPLADGVEAQHQKTAGTGIQHPDEEADGCRFPRSVGTEKTDHGTLRHRERKL